MDTCDQVVPRLSTFTSAPGCSPAISLPLELALARRFRLPEGVFTQAVVPDAPGVDAGVGVGVGVGVAVLCVAGGCVVALPLDTNTALEEQVEDPLLFRKNKWLICHQENQGLISKGVVPGITGCNHYLEY